MITIENNKVTNKTEHNNHICLTNEEVKCFKRKQELKKEVEANSKSTVHDLYYAMETKLVEDKLVTYKQIA